MILLFGKHIAAHFRALTDTSDGAPVHRYSGSSSIAEDIKTFSYALDVAACHYA